MSDIPFARLGVSQRLEPQLSPDAPRKVRLAIARGVVPLPPGEQMGALYVLAVGEDEEVRKSAIATMRGIPPDRVLQTLSLKTHPKILEFLTEFREPVVDLDERIGMMRTCNDRTLLAIASRAGPDLCESLTRNHERLLITPDLFVALHANPACSDRHLHAAESFLRMQKSLPDVPEKRPFQQDEPEAEPVDVASPEATVDAPTGADNAFAPMSGGGMDLMAEIEAALSGQQSPALLRQQEENLKMFDLDALEADGSVVHAGREIGVGGVQSAVKRGLASDKDTPIIIQADKESKTDILIRIIDEAKLADATKISVATRRN